MRANMEMKLSERAYKKVKDNQVKFKNLYLKAVNTLKPLNDQIEINIKSYSKVDDTTKSSINHVFKTVFNRTLEESEVRWAKPEWVGLAYLNKKLVSFCYIVDSKVLFDNKPVRVGGVGGVMTSPSYRGFGFARKLLKKVDEFMFYELNVDCGLLVCRDKLTMFYQSKNWYTIDCTLYYSMENEIKQYKNNTMLRSKEKRYQPEVIHVMGKLW